MAFTDPSDTADIEMYEVVEAVNLHEMQILTESGAVVDIIQVYDRDGFVIDDPEMSDKCEFCVVRREGHIGLVPLRCPLPGEELYGRDKASLN